MKKKILKEKLSKKNILILFTFLMILVILLRFFNLNSEDYWFDEINSFWLSDPQINNHQTYIERYLKPGQPDQITFYFILKYFFNIFGYNDFIGRYFPFIFGCLSIPVIVYSSIKIKNNSSCLFLFYLLAINTYLIAYSQEVRVYSLVFFISAVKIFLFLNLIDAKDRDIKWYKYLLILILNILNVSLHIFTSLILISDIIFLLYLYYFNKNLRLKLITVTVLSIFACVILNYQFILSKYDVNTWIPPLESKFFIDFFFARFFGSKIMGAIYLATTFYLLIKFRLMIINNNKKLLFLLILTTATYLLPIIYSLLVRPILIDRYIIFVLIPVLIMISILIWEIKNKKVKYFFILLLLISTTTNTFLELSFKKTKKPELTKLIETIDSKDSNIITVETNESTEFIMLSNYLSKKEVFNKKKLKIINFNKITEFQRVWVVCLAPLNSFNCKNKFNVSDKFKIKKNKTFYLTELFLIETKK